jgi:hypothetical protein
MNKELNELLGEISRLQGEVEKRWEDMRQQFNYTIEGHKVRFEAEIKRLHARYKIRLIKYLISARPLSIITAPVIYSMVVPIVFLDLAITIYQHICFRAYGIARVERRDYIIIDRHQLSYLNIIEKFNCVYCGYGNGFMAYAQEIIARTEQYWCPIKHARRVRATHGHYKDFSDYGDAENYSKQLDELRKALADIDNKPDAP